MARPRNSAFPTCRLRNVTHFTIPVTLHYELDVLQPVVLVQAFFLDVCLEDIGGGILRYLEFLKQNVEFFVNFLSFSLISLVFSLISWVFHRLLEFLLYIQMASFKSN